MPNTSRDPSYRHDGQGPRQEQVDPRLIEGDVQLQQARIDRERMAVKRDRAAMWQSFAMIGLTTVSAVVVGLTALSGNSRPGHSPYPPMR